MDIHTYFFSIAYTNSNSQETTASHHSSSSSDFQGGQQDFKGQMLSPTPD